MRRLALVLLLLIPSSLLAQPRDDRWRERPASLYRTPAWNLFEVTPFGGYRYGGTLWAERSNLFVFDTDVASSGNLGLNFGIPIGGTPMKLELMVNQQRTYLSGGTGLFEPTIRLADFDITYYHGGLQIPLGTPHGFNPFFVISAGVANLRPDLPGVVAENRFSASAGLGVKVPFNRNVGLRVEARGYFTTLGDDRDDCFRCSYDGYGRDLYQGETNVGLVFSF
ncbi:MAG TPA: hypothetical protein VNA04_07585 [Thermoanaerobaculia bacterium]|nr:hypothetical protein [Thermoanaerobaculia bacterium]